MKNKKINILNVSTNDKTKALLESLSFNGKLEIHPEKNIQKITGRFAKGIYDIVVIASDACKIAKDEYISIIESISEESPLTKIIFIAGPEDVDMGVLALKAGTYHYLKHPLSKNELKLLISAALEERPDYAADLDENENGEFGLGTIIGKSKSMQYVFKQIKQAASTDIPILILGETGTGKDMVAQTIHRLSKRSQHSFVPVNLGALPTELVASELFGHEKGSFTGAVEQRTGVFEQADEGTVFLDEIDTVDEKIQVSLLRLLDRKKFNRIGGKRVLSSNARIMVASNADLSRLVDQGVFRKDLFFRFDVFRIELPSLHERGEDIALITNEMLAAYNKTLKKNIKKVSPAVYGLFESYDWPGNVRELKNVIQRAVLVCNGNELLPEHLPQRMQKARPAERKIRFEIGTSLNSVEKEMILQALKAANNNRKKAAELLGISRRALYNKFKKHNIFPKE